MPNWASGDVKVSGNPKDIENFCKLFIFSRDEGKIDDSRKYFARSFTFQDWESFKKEYLGGKTAEFGVNFAWSCHNCMIEGYPQRRTEECITLADACKKYEVKVVIDTEEGGVGFEEHIECDENGKLTEECKDMLDYKCKSCGNVQMIGSKEDINEVECGECDKIEGWDIQNG